MSKIEISLRKIAEGHPEQVGDISTLLNPEVVEEIKKKFGDVQIS